MPTNNSVLRARNKALKIKIINKDWSLLFFLIFSIGLVACLVIGYMDDQVTAYIHGMDILRITELTAENDQLKSELSNIQFRTFQVWQLEDNEEIIAIGETRFLHELIPGSIGITINTEFNESNIRFVGNRTDIYVELTEELP